MITAILSELAEAAHWVAGALPKRNPVADLQVIRVVSLTAKSVTLQAGEWSHFRSVTIQATAEGTLDVQLPGRVLADYLSAQRAPTAILEPLEGALRVTGRGYCTIPTVQRTPLWPTELAGELAGEVDAAELAVALGDIDGHVRPQAQAGLDWENAVMLGRHPDGLLLQGGSPYSAGRVQLLGGWTEATEAALVSPWNLRDCLRGTSGPLQVEQADTVWRFTAGGRQFVLGHYDVRLPDFGKLFAAPRPHSLTVDSATLAELVQAVRLGSDVVNLHLEGGTLTVSSWADTKGRRTTGDAEVSAPCEGDDVDLRLNAEFLSVALDSMETAHLSWAANGRGPVKVSNDDGSVEHVIAPIRHTERS